MELYTCISQDLVCKLIDGGSNTHERPQMCCIEYFSSETDLTLTAKDCTFTVRLHDVLILPNFTESLPKYERYMMK